MALPCPSYPVRDRRQYPVDQTAVGGGGARTLLVQRANRRDERTVEIPYQHLSDTELADLLAVWADGAALVTPFQLVIPGDSTARWYVFLEPLLTTIYASATSHAASIVLLDVTPPDEISGGFAAGYSGGFS